MVDGLSANPSTILSHLNSNRRWCSLTHSSYLLFAALIALFVAIADLIPLVGATLGAVVASIAAFLHSVPAGIAA